MAIAATNLVYPGASMSEQSFASLIDGISSIHSGILTGCNVTVESATSIVVSNGFACVRGRLIEVIGGTLSVPLPASGTETRYLLLTVTIYTDGDNSASINVATSVPNDSPNYNLNGGKAYLSLATLHLTTSSMSATRGSVIDLNSMLANKASTNSPTFTGTPKAPTPASSTNNTQIATTAFVKTNINTALQESGVNSKADINSPAFTGTPTAPTAPNNTSSTQIATTAFVMNAVQNAVGGGIVQTVKYIDVTISSGSWSSGIYTYTNNVDVTSTNIMLITPKPGQTDVAIKSLQKASIVEYSQSAGQLKLKCMGSVPTIDVAIRIFFLPMTGVAG